MVVNAVQLNKLKKLRGKSPQELRLRGAQELAKLAERGLGVGAREPEDAALLNDFLPAARGVTVEAAAALIAERLRQPKTQRFFPALQYRAELVQLMNARFPAERAVLIERADRICAGYFDLLGWERLYFGAPVDWHLEPLARKRPPLTHWSEIDFLNPEVAGDKKIIWELNRHQFFITLGQAYWLTGDEKYAERFQALAQSWMNANPPKRGINWASSLELALRSISWLWALHLFADSPVLTPHFTARLLKYLNAQGRHIEKYLSTAFSPNTHLTGEALGLFYLGTALPELQRAEHWRELGLRILLEQLPLQVRRDGVYFEQSSYYHRYTADFYTHLLALALECGQSLPHEVGKKLTALLDHLLWITRPDGSATLYGDDDGGRLVTLGVRAANDFRDTLATGAVLFGRGDWKFVAGEAALETLWLLGPSAIKNFDQLSAVAPRQTVRAFGDSGFFIVRDGWWCDDSYLFIDGGRHGALGGGHAHADALSFEFAAHGVNWLVDPGTYTYTGDAATRNEARATAMHNCATVDGESQAIPAGPFAWRRTAEGRTRDFQVNQDGVFFAGQQNGYERLADPVAHERLLHFINADAARWKPAHLLVRDVFTAQERHRYQLHFHFSAECAVEAEGNRVRATAPNGSALLIVTCAVGAAAQVQAQVETSWVSRAYAQREHAPVAVMTTEARGQLELVTLIISLSAGHDRRAIEHFLEQRLATEVGVAYGALRPAGQPA